MLSIPIFLKDKTSASYPIPEDGSLTVFDGVSKAEYEEALRQFDGAAGFSRAAENGVGHILSASFRSETAFMQVSYNAAENRMRIASDRLDENGLSPLTVPPPSEKVCDVDLTVVSLRYRNGSITDANGMSYVFLLEDGSFLIYDGGWAEDAEPLYRYLRSHSPLEGGKIVISAWVLTHSHIDHYGAFAQFTKAYGDLVTLKNVFFNPIPRDERMINVKRHDGFLTGEFWNLIRTYEGARVTRLHTGQVVYLPGLRFEVLQTYEDVLPETCDWLNEASLVTRVHVGGQTLLFSGDCEIRGDRRLEQYGDALKSDFWQMPHHGWSGGSDLLIKSISPAYLFWATNYECYVMRTLNGWHGGQNWRILNYESVKHSFVSDGAYKRIRFPLTDPGQIEYFRPDP